MRLGLSREWYEKRISAEPEECGVGGGTMTELEKAQKALEERKERAKGLKRVRNEDLHAGSPMYFYCTDCGLESDVLPEGFTERPRRRCRACESLRRLQDGGGT